MPVDFTALKEGDAITAAALNTIFTNIYAKIDGPEPIDLGRGAFSQRHLPSAMPEAGWPTAGPWFQNGFQAQGIDAAGGLGTGSVYGNSFSIVGALPGGYGVLQTSFSGAGTNPPYGPRAAPDDGWRIPADTNAAAPADTMEVEVNASGTTLADSGLVGILVRGQVVVPTLNTVRPEGATPQDDRLSSFMIGIGYQEHVTGTRYVLLRSIRYWTSSTVIRRTVSAYAVLRNNDLSGGKVRNVFGVVASCRRGGDVTGGPGPQFYFTDSPTIDRFALSVWPILGVSFS